MTGRDGRGVGHVARREAVARGVRDGVADDGAGPPDDLLEDELEVPGDHHREERPEAPGRELTVAAPDDEAHDRRDDVDPHRLGGLLPDEQDGLEPRVVAGDVGRRDDEPLVELDDGEELLAHDEREGRDGHGEGEAEPDGLEQAAAATLRVAGRQDVAQPTRTTRESGRTRMPRETCSPMGSPSISASTGRPAVTVNSRPRKRSSRP